MVLFWLRKDTTRYFKLSKTRRIPPECITGFSIQIIFEILWGETCRRACGKTATKKYWRRYGSQISRQQRQKTKCALPYWKDRLKEPYGAYDIKIRFENGTDTARCIPRLLLVDDCAHNHASYNCKLSDVLSNSYGVRRWARPIAGNMSARISISEIFPSNFAW